MKSWANFYTPTELATKIINLVSSDYSPNYVVDICAGSGNFLDAAINRWNIEAVGVDLYPIANKTKNYTVYKDNALDFSKLIYIKNDVKKLVVANPPFGKLEQQILNICHRHQDLQFEAIKSNRMETNMIVSNMSLLQEGEVFAAVLPENIFSAVNLTTFKNIFLSYFDILHLSKPEKYFRGSEVKTRIFIGRYKSVRSNISRKKKYVHRKISNKVLAIRGIDNSKLIKNPTDIIEKDLSEVIHFSNDVATLNMICYTQEGIYSDEKKLLSNDLLISRVGRNSGKVHKLKNSFVGKYASDYFYIIRNFRYSNDDYFINILEEKLLKKVAGLTAKYLRKEDILQEIASIEDANTQ